MCINAVINHAGSYIGQLSTWKLSRRGNAKVIGVRPRVESLRILSYYLGALTPVEPGGGPVFTSACVSTASGVFLFPCESEHEELVDVGLEALNVYCTLYGLSRIVERFAEGNDGSCYLRLRLKTVVRSHLCL